MPKLELLSHGYVKKNVLSVEHFFLGTLTHFRAALPSGLASRGVRTGREGPVCINKAAEASRGCQCFHSVTLSTAEEAAGLAGLAPSPRFRHLLIKFAIQCWHMPNIAVQFSGQV